MNVAIYKESLAGRAYGGESRDRAKDAWRTWEKNYVEDMNYEAEKEIEVHDVVMAEYGISSTVHNAQGGEWETVIIDFIRPSREENNNARFWYTAFSRPESKLVILSDEEFFKKYYEDEGEAESDNDLPF